MQRIRQIQRGYGYRAYTRGDGSGESLTGGAQGRDDSSALAAHKQHASLRETVEVDHPGVMLLDDLQAVAAAGAASQLGRGGECGMREHQDGGGRWFGISRTIQQTSGIICDGDLDDFRQVSEGGEFHD